MNRLLGALLALTLTFVLALVAPASAAETDSSAVAGTVTSSSDGAPLAGISVGLYAENGSYRMGTSTDASGQYQFPGGLPGNYRLRFTSTNTITQWYGGDEVSGSVVTLGDTGVVDVSTTLKPAGIVRGTYAGPDPSRVVMKMPWFTYPTSPVFTVGGGEFTAKVTTERPFVVGLEWTDAGSSASTATSTTG